jgi:hypothetical protein
MKRPWYLTVWLIIIVIGGVFSVLSYTLGAGAITQVLPQVPSWAIWVLALLSALVIVGAVMLWMWKMMGFYILIGVTAVSTVINIMYLGAESIIWSVLGTIILWLMMRPVWQNFK